MVETVQEAIQWFRAVDWKTNTFPHQMDTYPNDGVMVTRPIVSGDGEFSPKLHNPKNEKNLLHNHKDFVLLYMYSGACDTTVDKTPLTLREGDILMITPNVLHRNALIDPDGIMFHCIVGNDFLCQAMLPLLAEDALFSMFILGFLRDARTRGHLYFPASEDHAEIGRTFEKILIEYANRQPLYRARIRALLGSFLTLLARTRYPLKSETSGALGVSAIMEYIGAHGGNVTLAQMARDLHYHQNYLSARIRSETGESFSQITRAYRLMRASFLLKERTLSTEEIAHMVGYRDISGFYRAYRRHFGQAPRESVKVDAK